MTKLQSDIDERSSVISILPANEIEKMAIEIKELQEKLQENESLWETAAMELEGLESKL